MTLLHLSGLEPFSVGGRRECYVHPNDPSKCIKVLRTDKNRTVRIKKTGIASSLLRREYNNNAHEMKILKRIEKQIGKCMQTHLPLCYGYEATDKGAGLVLDLIRDSDGRISRSLRELLSSGYSPMEFMDAFEEFSLFLLDNVILTRNLLDHNIVAKKNGDGIWSLHIIDGLGDPAWLPFARWNKRLGRRKINRRINRAWSQFEAFWKSGGVTDKMQKNSTWDQGILRYR